MNVYLYQNWSTRGRIAVARSQTLRAWFTNLFRISISAYLSQSDCDRWSMSSARLKAPHDSGYSCSRIHEAPSSLWACGSLGRRAPAAAGAPSPLPALCRAGLARFRLRGPAPP